MKIQFIQFWIVMAMATGLVALGCSDSGPGDSGEGDTDADSDTDGDTDADADSDTDGDTDTDADSDTGTGTNADTDSDTDTDAVDDCVGNCVPADVCMLAGGVVDAGGTCADPTQECCDAGGGLPECTATCIMFPAVCSGVVLTEEACSGLGETCCDETAVDTDSSNPTCVGLTHYCLPALTCMMAGGSVDNTLTCASDSCCDISGVTLP